MIGRWWFRVATCRGLPPVWNLTSGSAFCAMSTCTICIQRRIHLLRSALRNQEAPLKTTTRHLRHIRCHLYTPTLPHGIKKHCTEERVPTESSLSNPHPHPEYACMRKPDDNGKLWDRRGPLRPLHVPGVDPESIGGLRVPPHCACLRTLPEDPGKTWCMHSVPFEFNSGGK